MKKTKRILFLVLTCILLLSSICFATNTETEGNVNSTNNGDKDSQKINILNTDLYISENDIVIENAINGNVFAMGSNVTIKGEIVGDLFVMAKTLTIEDTAVIYSNVFALANQIVMKGSAYDIYAIGNSLELTKSAYIYRDLKVYSGNLTLNGTIKKDVYVSSGSITFPEDAKGLIGGNLNYSNSKEISIPEGAVLGEVKYTANRVNTPTKQEVIYSYIISFIMTIIYAIIVIILATFYAPKFIEKANYNLIKRPFISAGIGILAIVIIPMLALFLMITGFLAYIGIALLALYVMVLSITLAIFSMAIAKIIEKKLKEPSKGKFILFAIISAIILWILQIIPYIGTYISIFISVVGLGVFLFSFFMKKDTTELEKAKQEKTK